MSYKKELLELQENTLKLIREKMPSSLTYHNYHHTVDVRNATEQLAREEGISEDDILLLTTAAVFHDAGYLSGRHNHEEKSCEMAREGLIKAGVDNNTIDKICSIIFATRIPHEPKNKLEEIICDADLDYLGRDDYYSIAENVFTEFKNEGIVKDENEWNNLQIKFFGSHRYFTATSKRLRDKKKEDHLNSIRAKIEIIRD